MSHYQRPSKKLFLIALPTFLALILFAAALVQLHSTTFALPEGGGTSGASIPTINTVDTGLGGDSDGIDTKLALFRAKKDDRRNRWNWTQENGWKLTTIEETYQNGWAWIWRDGQWYWESINDSAPGKVKQPLSSSQGTQHSVSDIKEAGCFSHQGDWISDRTKCANDQLEKVKMALQDSDLVTQGIPQVIIDALKIVAPNSPSEETKILHSLHERFQGKEAAIMRQSVLEEATSDIVHKLSILKESEALTDTERQYFVSKIVEAQKFLKQDDALLPTDTSNSSVHQLNILVAEVQKYVHDHSIIMDTSKAPSDTQMFLAVHRILRALPSAFHTMESAGYSTSNITSMHLRTQSIADSAASQCQTLRKDCSRITDIVAQTELIVSIMNSMVEASGNSALKSEIQTSFRDALSH